MTEISDGILSDLGLDDVVDGLAAGKYAGNVFDAKVQDLPGKGKYLIFTYKVNDPESKFNSETVDEWFSLDKDASNLKKRFLKSRVLSLGVPEDRVSSFNPVTVKGEAIWFTVKKNGQYTNVTKVELRGENETGTGESADLSDLL